MHRARVCSWSPIPSFTASQASSLQPRGRSDSLTDQTNEALALVIHHQISRPSSDGQKKPDTGVEDLWVFHAAGTGVEYELGLPDGWRLHKVDAVPGLVELRDQAGVARLRMHARGAWDAGGVRHSLDASVAGNRIAVGIPESAVWPIAVDPEWQSTGSMAWVSSEVSATTMPGGRVLCIPHTDSQSAAAEFYDPASGTFTATGKLNLPRTGFSSVLLSNGRVLVVGGVRSWASTGVLQGVGPAEECNPATGAFELRGDCRMAAFSLLAGSAD